jgi:hypothetical protein
MRPGDPAALFDTKTTRISWLAVSAWEKVQVGHYYLLKRQYAEAWKWYSEAERELPPPAAPTLEEFLGGLQNRGFGDFALFQNFCLRNLGRQEEAKAKLEQFRQTFLPKLPAELGKEAGWGTNLAIQIGLQMGLDKLLAPDNIFANLIRDLYAAEVFTSLDAADDAETFFREAFANAKTDEEQLSSLLTLSQVLLLEGKHEEYSKLAREKLVPSILRVRSALPASKGNNELFDMRDVLDLIVDLALLPLQSPDFLSTLPKQEPSLLAERWEKLRAEGKADNGSLLDELLVGVYRQLGKEQEWQAVVKQLQTQGSSPRAIVRPGDDISESIKLLRTSMRQMFQWQRGRN